MRSAIQLADLHRVEPAALAAAIKQILGVPGRATDGAANETVDRVAPVFAALRRGGNMLACDWDATLPTEAPYPR